MLKQIPFEIIPAQTISELEKTFLTISLKKIFFNNNKHKPRKAKKKNNKKDKKFTSKLKSF